MNTIITNHAIIRRYERYHKSNETFDRPSLVQEILDEFNKGNLVEKNNDYCIYQNDRTTFVTHLEGKKLIIVTLFPKNKERKILKKNHIKISDNNRYLKDIKQIKKLIVIDNLLILKHMGAKKILYLNNFVMLARIEEERNKLFIKIINKWDEQDFLDLNFLKDFKSRYFGRETEIEWIKFLQKMNIYDYVYTIKNKDYSSEVKVYQEILNGNRAKFPTRFWQDDLGGESAIASREIVKYLIEDYLGWSRNDLYNKFTSNLFNKYKLGGMLSTVFDCKSYLALLNAYPDLKVWKFKKYSCYSYWEVENDGIQHAKKAIQWVGEKLFDNYKGYNKNAILSINWFLTLERYNLQHIILKTFNTDYKKFFKELFNIDCTDLEVQRYYHSIHHKESQLRNKSVRVFV